MTIPVLDQITKFNALRDWKRRGWSDHAPQFVKQAIFGKYTIDGATWVETGTYLGRTTRFLASLSPCVYTIEPAPKLYKRAKRRFRNSHVHVLNGLSETIIPQLLPKLSGNVCFWLDGHYSAGQTFQGPTDCPIIQELDAIAAHRDNFDKMSILIDDVRCFLPSNTTYPDYPPLDYLVDWARTHDFEWRIEQDIFILRNWA